MKVLITGGAGFIGQHLSKALLAQGADVRILDNYSPQIHNNDSLPSDLAGKVEFVKSDIRDYDAMRGALSGVNCVVHLAAETGTGQSMYEISRYFDVNVQGTAVLLDLLQNDPACQNVENIVLASSRAIYGEGAYTCSTHGVVYPNQRSRDALEVAHFEPTCPHCKLEVKLTPTLESAPFKPMSMYGLTKQVQEQAILLFAQTRGINAFGLRYQNVYGPGQSLKNPYTGILAVFSNLARQNQKIEIYEDGHESRDFVYIDDVVEATVRAALYKENFVGAINVGSGVPTTVLQVAEAVKTFFKSSSNIGVTGAFRLGDIRHNIADITKLKAVLNFTPSVNFNDGLTQFLSWAHSQEAQDKTAYLRSVEELASRGLMGKSN